MARRRYTPNLKAQVVLEVLAGDRTPRQVANAYRGTRTRLGCGSGVPSSGRRRSSPRTGAAPRRHVHPRARAPVPAARASDPSILGTLFERSLDPGKRSQPGPHYMDRDKILRIVDPWCSMLALSSGRPRTRTSTSLARAPASSVSRLGCVARRETDCVKRRVGCN